ncbi:MAG: 1,4-alpha-glucan branching enzyme, partial [Solirubrobacteraceae bacterium]|nr:1,4-alpha-glucan branching enzyme [Solirubrobacteraceae bacterium]
MTSRARDRGELALVLHTHMPYVEGFGTWPFGEEWLWEVMATSYLPLLDVLEREEAAVTLSLTPVLCDQLEAPGVADRFVAFLREVRAETHRQDIEGCRAGAPELVAELEASARDYAWADERFEAIGRDLLGTLAPHASWTSAASHAVLPLLATDAGVELQVATGIASHRRRFGAWGGGFWLPECGYADWLGPLLVDLGVQAVCVDLTDFFGAGAPIFGTPHHREDGPALVPIDRWTMELVWSDRGYPAHGSYRDYHHHTIHHHRPWANDGSPYDREAARALAREHARHFVGSVRARLGEWGEFHRQPPLCVCALDTELLGHWWHEGIAWLDAVIDEAAAQGVALTRLDDALARRDPVILNEPLPVTTWGTPRDLSTWDGPQVAEFAWRARAGELRAAAAGERGGERAARELLALQASDWAFMVTRG